MQTVFGAPPAPERRPVVNENFLRAARLERLAGAEPYLENLAAVRWLLAGNRLEFTTPVTCLVGENGTGKSTLLEALAVGCGLNAEGGSRNLRFSTKPTHAALWRCLVLRRGPRRERDGFFLRAESFYNVASQVDAIQAQDGRMLNAYGGRSLHEQSHGESFLALVQNRFGPGGLYFLDEPEAALSPMRQLALARALGDLAGQGCQIVMATHSPILMALPGARVLELTEEGLQEVPWRDTEHCRVLKGFLNDPERILRYLWEEE